VLESIRPAFGGLLGNLSLMTDAPFERRGDDFAAGCSRALAWGGGGALFVRDELAPVKRVVIVSVFVRSIRRRSTAPRIYPRTADVLKSVDALTSPVNLLFCGPFPLRPVYTPKSRTPAYKYISAVLRRVGQVMSTLSEFDPLAVSQSTSQVRSDLVVVDCGCSPDFALVTRFPRS